MEIKKCNKCLEIKNIGEFRIHCSTKDKLTTYCKACLYVLTRKSVLQNKEQINKNSIIYRKKNREQIRLNSKRWRETHKGKKNADTAKRYAAKMQRIPKWLTKDEKERMSCYYQLASMRTQESGNAWHVDHIVPMRGKDVSGLHVPWNLRVISAQENMNKGNRYGN